MNECLLTLVFNLDEACLHNLICFFLHYVEISEWFRF